MLGAIIGDTVGSVFEFNNTKDVNFPLFCERSNYTDDSLMSLAVAKWLTVDKSFSHDALEEMMVQIATDYPCPMGGYGGGFRRWLFAPEKLRDFEDGTKSAGRRPYNSWGNGSAMRASAVGWMFDTIEETERIAELSASITHNHPEGIKGAQATAAAIFMARTGAAKEEIREYIQKRYGYDLSKTWSDIHPTYGWEDSCQGTVPPAIIAFLDSDDVWLPEKTERQLGLMKKTGSPLSYTAIEMIGEDGTLIKPHRKVKESVDYRFLLRNTMIATSSVIADRELLYDFRMPLRRSGQDYATWLRLLRGNKVAVGINEVLVRYRISGNSLSSNKFKSVKQVWEIQTRDEGIGKLCAAFNLLCFCFNAFKKHFM